jgi:hypothetical protein
MASGMNWLNPKSGIYEPSQTELEISADGFAVISRAQTRLITAPNVNRRAEAYNKRT